MTNGNPMAIAILSVAELAKMLLTGYLSLSAQQGKTLEQIKAEAATEWEKFLQRKPENIPDLPEV